MIYSAVLVAVGGTGNKKSEKLEDGSWNDIEEPPISESRIYGFATVFHAGNHYFFGGNTGSNLKSILRLSGSSWTWSNVGQLNEARHGLGVILVKNTFMVVGGWGTYKNEACLLNDEQFTCTQQATGLADKAWTPLMYLVSDNYGNC